MKLKPIYFILLLSLSFGAFANDEEDEEEVEEAAPVTKATAAPVKTTDKTKAAKIEAKKEKVNIFVNAVKAKSADQKNKQDMIDED